MAILLRSYLSTATHKNGSWLRVIAVKRLRDSSILLHKMQAIRFCIIMRLVEISYVGGHSMFPTDLFNKLLDFLISVG